MNSYSVDPEEFVELFFIPVAHSSLLLKQGIINIEKGNSTDLMLACGIAVSFTIATIATERLTRIAYTLAKPRKPELPELLEQLLFCHPDCQAFVFPRGPVGWIPTHEDHQVPDAPSLGGLHRLPRQH